MLHNLGRVYVRLSCLPAVDYAGKNIQVYSTNPVDKLGKHIYQSILAAQDVITKHYSMH